MSENSITVESLFNLLHMMRGSGWANYPIYLVLKNGNVSLIKEFGMELVPKDSNPEIFNILPHIEFFNGGLFLKEL